MSISPLFTSTYRPQLTGHETFPLRYGWLKKAFDEVAKTEKTGRNKSLFRDDDAIARFGVGKNMVGSMRHWAIVAEIIEDNGDGSRITTTPFGRKIFAGSGFDPFMEHPSTLWLVHWNLASRAENKTTWFWAFNHFHNSTFDREHLVQGLEKLARDQEWSRTSTSTIKRDVECFVRTYVARSVTATSGLEDALECPLAELGLIKPIGRRDGFRFARGPKSSLDDGVFLYALTDFWRRFSDNTTLSFETLGYEPGSPGRVFLLDETDLAERLFNIEEDSAGAFQWSETAGLKQIVRNIDLEPEVALNFIDLAYPQKISRREVA